MIFARQPINGDHDSSGTQRTARELIPATGPGQAGQPAEEVLLITAEEVARLLSVSVRTVVRLTTQRRLRAVKVGRATRYVLADVRAYVRSLQRHEPGKN